MYIRTYIYREREREREMYGCISACFAGARDGSWGLATITYQKAKASMTFLTLLAFS